MTAAPCVRSDLGSGPKGFFHGGEFNRKYGNKLMRARVVLQGVAIVIFVVAMLALDA